METVRISGESFSFDADENTDLATLVGFIEVEVGYSYPVEWPVFAGESCKIEFVEIDEIPF